MQPISFTQSNILIIGDIMLDKYHFGRVHRISPEAPVPVVKVVKSRFTLGGAGNVANNIARLHGNAILTGFVGRDSNKDILSGMLNGIGVTAHLIETELPTVTKVRVIGEHQQIVRLDFEENVEIDNSYAKKIIDIVNTEIEKVNAVIISDYGKGVCSDELCRDVIDAANERNISVVIDPKGADWSKYANATIVTPNVKELGEVVGRDIANEDGEIERYGMEVLRRYALEYLLVTRSEKGMSLISTSNVIHIPTEAKEVFDVSGAGDTVVATLSAAIASGMDLISAVELANKAAGIVVSKIGTAAIEYDELISVQDGRNTKIVDVDRISMVVKGLREKGKAIVFTNGCFDILHRGHISYLREAKKFGDVLVVGLNSDDSVRRLKGDNRPVNKQEDRAEMLASMEFVDYVTIFEEDTPHRLIQEVMPDLLVKGGDYEPGNIVGREFAGKTVTIPFMEGYSTTNLLKQTQKDNSIEVFNGQDDNQRHQ